MSLNRITRRDALLLLGAGTLSQARAEGVLQNATHVDHVSLAVGDIDKAMLFYRRLFGDEVLKDSRTSRRILRLGSCHMTIAPAAAGEAKCIDHFGIGIGTFNASAVKRGFETAGLYVSGSNDGLYTIDPDGIRVQIEGIHPWENTKNALPEGGPKHESLFHPRGIDHLAIRVSDMMQSTEFYRKLFGPPTPRSCTPQQTTFRAGETRIILYNRPSPTPPGIDYFSVAVDMLSATAKMSNQANLIEFFDPDRIRLKVTLPGQTYAC